MVNSFLRWLRGNVLPLGLPVFVVAVGLVVWLAVRANRPTDGEDSSAEVAGEQAEPGAVRLARADLEAAAGIEVEPVKARSVDGAVTCNGSVEFNLNKYVKVPPKADGILREVNVDVGKVVHVGELLAVVNSQAFGELKASLIKADVHEEHLRWQLDRYTQAGDSIPVKNIFETKHLLEEQLTDTARIRTRLKEYGLDSAQIDAVVKDKEVGIQLPVFAPRDGMIVEREAVVGEVVNTQMSLFTIADLDTLWLHLYVYENQLPSVRLGQSVTFWPDGLPGQGFEGRVTWISPQVDPQTRTIQVRAEVTNRDGVLRSNMFGKGELHVQDPQPRLVVPESAVQSIGSDHIVFVQKPDNLFEVRKIVIGLKSDRYWEVRSGLTAGERVATTGSFLLKSNLENPDFGKVE